MELKSLRSNPLIAAVLGTVVTGLGHLYLRRWLRALGWLGLTVAASVLFVPESTIAAVSSGTLTELSSALPIILVSAASALDAYLIAKVKTQTAGVQSTTTVGSTGTDESPACPACGKPVDPDLGFCHWCTSEFDVVAITDLQQVQKRDSN